jgi:predicted nucleic acid-binding protein
MGDIVMLLIVDADALVMLADCRHENHARCKEIVESIAKYRVSCIYPITAICEAVTVLQKILQRPEAAEFLLKLVKNGIFTTEDINNELLLEAMTRFNPFSKQRGDTLFDAIIATIAIRHEADAVFSFDQGYRRKGLRLAGDLF